MVKVFPKLEALEDCEIWEIPKIDFDRICEKYPKMTLSRFLNHHTAFIVNKLLFTNSPACLTIRYSLLKYLTCLPCINSLSMVKNAKTAALQTFRKIIVLYSTLFALKDR